MLFRHYKRFDVGIRHFLKIKLKCRCSRRTPAFFIMPRPCSGNMPQARRTGCAASRKDEVENDMRLLLEGESR